MVARRGVEGSLHFTVFTPTYNRSHTLRRVYDSLVRQRYEQIEWLVVDDGSTDATTGLLHELAATSPFPVRILRQENRGKHVAHNRAVEVARGELTVILDSDDELLDEALPLLWSEWIRIPGAERTGYSGIMAHSVDAEGRLLGRLFPRDAMDGEYLPLVASGFVVGDKLPCYRTDLLRRFPFPGEEQREVIPEGTIWCRIGSRYQVRCVNRFVLRVHRDGSHDGSLSVRTRQRAGAYGRRLYAIAILDEGRRYFPRHAGFLLRHAVLFVRASLHSGLALGGQYRALAGVFARAMWLAALPVGTVLWVNDRSRVETTR